MPTATASWRRARCSSRGCIRRSGWPWSATNFMSANTDALLRFPYEEGQTRIDQPGERVVELPAGPINAHWTKNVIASRDGSRLYVTVGSNSNVADHGMAAEEGRAAIWQIDRATGEHRIFASGLRNPVGLAFEPETGALWTTVNERDELGSDLVPDYMTAVRDGAFYGWPYSYYGDHVDTRVEPQRPDLVARAVVPDYALGPHTASLGLAFADGAGSLPAQFRDGALVGQHGSWNRRPRSGYKVIFVPFRNGTTRGRSGRRADRISQRRRRGARPPGRRRDRPARRAAGRRRRRQPDLARDCGGRRHRWRAARLERLSGFARPGLARGDLQRGRRWSSTTVGSWSVAERRCVGRELKAAAQVTGPAPSVGSASGPRRHAYLD